MQNFSTRVNLFGKWFNFLFLDVKEGKNPRMAIKLATTFSNFVMSERKGISKIRHDKTKLAQGFSSSFMFAKRAHVALEIQMLGLRDDPSDFDEYKRLVNIVIEGWKDFVIDFINAKDVNNFLLDDFTFYYSLDNLVGMILPTSELDVEDKPESYKPNDAIRNSHCLTTGDNNQEIDLKTIEKEVHNEKV